MMKNIITTFAVLIIVSLFTADLYSQSSGDFRSAADGNWSAAATWETYNGTAWAPAAAAPDGSETITVNHTVTVDVAVAVSGHITAAAAGDLTVGTGSLTFGTGSVYQHDRNGGGIPVSTWNEGSTCLITGITGNSPANANQNYYNFTWNCPAQGSNLDVRWSGNTIGGDVRVENTASSQLRLTSSGEYSNPITINGNVYLLSGVLTATGSSTAMNYIVTVNGNIIVTGGSFALSRGSGGQVDWILSGDLTLSDAELRSSNAASRFVFTVDNDTQSVSYTNVTYNGTVNYAVDSATVVNILTTSDTIAIRGTVENRGDFRAEGNLSFENNSVYKHMRDEGTLPTAVWRDGSTFELLGVVTDPPDNANQNFFNVIYNSPSQNGNKNLGWNGNTIGGDITVLSTGAGRWQLCAPTFGESASVDIMGDITMTNGNFTSNGTGNGNTTIVINTYGNINVSGGNFSVSRGSQSATGTTTWNLYGDLIMSNTTTQNSNPTGAKFVFSGTAAQNLVLTDVTLTALPIEVDTGAVLNIGSSQLLGSGMFNLNSGAELQTSNPGGLDSTFKNTGSIVFSPEASYTYNGTTAQITGALMPQIAMNITINNPAGVTLSHYVMVRGMLNINSGSLDLNNQELDFSNTGMLNETPGNTLMGNGNVHGIGMLNAPVNVNVAGLGVAITSAADLNSVTVERIHQPAVGMGNQGIAKQWQVLPINNSGLNASARFYYDETELNGIPEANLIVFRSPSGDDNTWIGVGGTVNTADNFVELTGINNFTYFTLGDNANPLPVELTSFTASANGPSVTLKWATATEQNNRGWQIERKASDDKAAEWQKVGFVDGKGNSTELLNYTFVDDEVQFGSYGYRIKQLDFDGSAVYSDVVEVDVMTPKEFSLHQNFPNPFNPSTVIRYELPEASFVTLTIFNALGQKVMDLVNQKMEAGVYNQLIDAGSLTSGTYIYRLTAGDIVFTKKMMFIK